MTMSKTIQLQRTGLTPIDVEPVWVNDEIQHFDMYNKGIWIGSLRLLSFCEHKVSQSSHEDDWIYTESELRQLGFKEIRKARGIKGLSDWLWFEDNGIKIYYNNLIKGK